jgi:hypothetical protein
MATKALFINLTELKKKSIIDGSLDSNKILQYIELAQDIHIQNYLGGSLYKKIQQLIVDGEIDLAGNADYKLLLDDYIKPMHIWYSQAVYIPFSGFQIDNGGLFKHTSENSDSSTRDDLDYLTRKALSNAEFYAKRFLDYMCEYGNDYPEYCTTSDSENMNPDRSINYSGGWHL